MKNIVVTGGSGKLGRVAVRHLMEHGYKVVSIDLATPPGISNPPKPTDPVFSRVNITDFGQVLLTHGDEFCTDDAAYQQFRKMVRDPRWQAEFLAKTIPERLAMAQQARGESQAANQAIDRQAKVERRR